MDTKPVDASSAAAEASVPPPTSYRQIVRSSAVVGGAQLFVVAIGIARTKAMALLLGPAGFGIWGVFNSVLDLAASVASMGVGSSGVRQIAESAGSTDTRRIARTVAALRRTSLVLGVFGALLVAVLSHPISRTTFGSDSYAGGVAVLGLAVALRLVSYGQLALLQGLRRIRDLAATNVLGALFGSVVAIVFIYALGANGIPWALAALAAGTLVVSWHFARRVECGAHAVPLTEVRTESVALLRLGAAFTISGTLMMGAAYLVRAIVLRLEGAEAAGFFQAAWTLGGLYIGIILQAMAADFYPRLTAIIHEHLDANRIVNEQAQVSLLLAGPGIVATQLLAPVLIALFYSPAFGAAADTLKWICLGMALRVVSWPLGYIVIAKGNQRIFIVTELCWAVVNVSLSWVCVKLFGIAGAGIAFFASYAFHAVMMYAVARRITGFHWARATAQIFAAFAIIVVGGFLASFVLSPWVAAGVGLAGATAVAALSMTVIVRLMGPGSVPAGLWRLLSKLRVTPPSR